ncbi:10046_t:CDS:2, partial [Gigaspora rosea]
MGFHRPANLIFRSCTLVPRPNSVTAYFLTAAVIARRRLRFSLGKRLKDSVITKEAASTKAKDTGLIFEDITDIMSEEVAYITPKGVANITFEKAADMVPKGAKNATFKEVADTKGAENATLEEVADTKGAENATLEEVADTKGAENAILEEVADIATK